MNNDWIKNLKAGDSVIVKEGSYNGTRKISTVARITPTGRIVVDGYTFNSDGYQRGADRYWWQKLEEATPQAIDEILRSNKIKTVVKKMADTKTITYEQAVAIEQILNEVTP